MDTEFAKFQLQNAGYLVKTCSPWHLQVKNKGGDIIINVWPTANKILRDFAPGPAEIYDDMLKAVHKLLRRTLKDQAADLRKLYPIEPPPDELLLWWRDDPIKNLSEYICKIKQR